MTGFYSCYKTDKNCLRVNMVWGDAVLTLETVVGILNHVSRSITRSLSTLEATNVVK